MRDLWIATASGRGRGQSGKDLSEVYRALPNANEKA